MLASAAAPARNLPDQSNKSPAIGPIKITTITKMLPGADSPICRRLCAIPWMMFTTRCASTMAAAHRFMRTGSRLFCLSEESWARTIHNIAIPALWAPATLLYFRGMADLSKLVRTSKVATNGIHLHIAEAGPPDGPLVLLLHGFPEFWYSWRNQIPPLAERGFHVVAPDLRGYNLSDKPEGVAAYDLDQLAADVAGLADHFGREKFAVAGHDWGGAVAWWLAGLQPARVARLAALNAPHPAVWIEAMRNDPVQKRKSSYVRMFQLPYLPELLIGINKGALAKGFRDSTRPDAFTTDDLARYRETWAQPGALTATINYYRAVLKKPLRPASEYRIAPPTLIIWGKRDAYAIPALAETSRLLCSNGRIEYLEQATHWVQHDEPDRVTALLADFFK